jgi:hypothetical protein
LTNHDISRKFSVHRSMRSLALFAPLQSLVGQEQGRTIPKNGPARLPPRRPKGWSISTLKLRRFGAFVLFHPSAVRYYCKIGVGIPDSLGVTN